MCLSTLCYWNVLLLQYDPSVSVKIIWEAYEQNLDCILLFCMLQLPKKYIFLSVGALLDHLLLHHRAEDMHSSTRWHHVYMEYNVLHKIRSRNLYNPLKVLRINRWTMSSFLGLFIVVLCGVSGHLNILYSNFSYSRRHCWDVTRFENIKCSAVKRNLLFMSTQNCSLVLIMCLRGHKSFSCCRMSHGFSYFFCLEATP